MIHITIQGLKAQNHRRRRRSNFILRLFFVIAEHSESLFEDPEKGIQRIQSNSHTEKTVDNEVAKTARSE